jgi:hypothetical protein
MAIPKFNEVNGKLIALNAEAEESLKRMNRPTEKSESVGSLVEVGNFMEAHVKTAPTDKGQTAEIPGLHKVAVPVPTERQLSMADSFVRMGFSEAEAQVAAGIKE